MGHGASRPRPTFAFGPGSLRLATTIVESGSGKTAGALSILRLIPDPPGRATQGEIPFAGRDLLQLSDEEIRPVRGADIGMIFQEPMTSLNPVLTALPRCDGALHAARADPRLCGGRLVAYPLYDSAAACTAPIKVGARA